MNLNSCNKYFVLSRWQDECVDILHQTTHLTVTEEVVQIKFAVRLVIYDQFYRLIERELQGLYYENQFMK